MVVFVEILLIITHLSEENSKSSNYIKKIIHVCIVSFQVLSDRNLNFQVNKKNCHCMVCIIILGIDKYVIMTILCLLSSHFFSVSNNH